MAGNPFLRLVLQRVRAKGGWSPVLERVASGESLTKIAADFGCSRHSIYKLLHKNEQLWNLFVEARRESAFALAEEGTEILDSLAEPNKDGSLRVVTREDIALARERVAQRRWLAQSYDRETFGIQSPEQSGASITVGALHLRVLMAPPTQPKALPAPAPTDALEVEVLNEDDEVPEVSLEGDDEASASEGESIAEARLDSEA